MARLVSVLDAKETKGIVVGTVPGVILAILVRAVQGVVLAILVGTVQRVVLVGTVQGPWSGAE